MVVPDERLTSLQKSEGLQTFYQLCLKVKKLLEIKLLHISSFTLATNI